MVAWQNHQGNTMDPLTGLLPTYLSDGFRSSDRLNSPVEKPAHDLSAPNSLSEMGPTQQISHQSQIISSSGSISSQFKQSSEASIEIVTQDGDRVSLTYSALLQSSARESFSQDAQNAAYSAQYSSSSSIAIQYKVEGELDAGEQKAIKNLMTEIGNISGQFFKGDVQAAFNSALELGFDSSELKTLAVDLQQSTQVKYVESYRQTEQLSNPVNAATNKDTNASNPAPAIDVLSQLEQLLSRLEEDASLKNAEGIVKGILNEMFDMLAEEFEFPVASYLQDVINQF